MAVLTTLMAGALFTVALDPQQEGAAKKSDSSPQHVEACRLSEMLDLEVHDATGERIADLSDVLFRSRDGHVCYAVLSRGGIGGLGEDRFVVPFDRLELRGVGEQVGDDVEPHWMADMKVSELEACPIYEENNEFDTAWNEKVRSHFEGAESESGKDGSMASKDEDMAGKDELVRSSILVGHAVDGSKDESIGEVDEIIVDSDGACIAYCVLGIGGVAGLGEKAIAVPFESLDVGTKPAGDDETLLVSLPVTETRLEAAPEYDDSNWERMRSPVYLQEVYVFYKVKPYWERAIPAGYESEKDGKDGKDDMDREKKDGGKDREGSQH